MTQPAISAEPTRLPGIFLWGAVAVSLLPAIPLLLGWRWEMDAEASGSRDVLFAIGTFRPLLVYSLLEWTAGWFAIGTATVAIFHFLVRGDATTPAVGTALFFAGLIDLCHSLGSLGFIPHVASSERFIPFTWFLSRLFHVSILLLGIIPVLSGRARLLVRERTARTVVLVGVMYGLIAYSLIHICARVEVLPRSLRPDGPFYRPWDAIPLVLYLLAGGIVLRRFDQRQVSIFSQAMLFSTIPHMAAQVYVTFGAESLFDPNVYAASVLKMVGYLLPLVGLLYDYARAQRAEAQLLATREKLRVARSVQKDLLPQETPSIKGFDLAGISRPANAIGGDYFDYVSMGNDRLGVVVADVSGHEIGSAILMAQTRAYVRAALVGETDAADALDRTAHFLSREVRGNRFVCFLFGELQPNGDVTLFTFGHDAHLVHGGDEYRNLESMCPPLGVQESITESQPYQISLEHDDVLLLVTDGLTETSSPTGELYGTERLIETIKRLRGESAKEIVAELRRSLEVFSNYTPQVDDVTIVVIKRK